MDRKVAAGGSRVLAELIDKHGGAILSDLLHHYQVDLRDLFAEEDPLSPRYVLELIMWLPTSGALTASRRGGHQFKGWDEDRYALAALVNAMRANNHILLLANSDPKKSSKPKPPEMFPIPQATDTKPKAYKPNSFGGIVAKMMASQKRKKRELDAKQRRR